MPGEAEARVRGIPNIPSITEINVRSGAGTHHPIAFKTPVGMDAIPVLEVQPDGEGRNLNGKVYQWWKLHFHGGAVGWVRDDLLEVRGDLTRYGYPDLDDYRFAFDLTRRTGDEPVVTDEAAEDESAATEADDEPAAEPESAADAATEPDEEAPAEEETPAPESHEEEPAEPIAPVGEREHSEPTTTTTADAPFPDALADTERVRKAAFAITSAFEGSGYASYFNGDAAIVSYGFLQFSLAAGSLATVIQKYVAAADSDAASTLERYLPRVQSRDSLLRNDTGFRDALLAAANEEEMRQAQEEVAEAGFWKAVVDGYIMHRGLRLPLTWALLFDMGVNFGTNHGFVRLAEKQLGVPPRSKPGENGITEEQLMTRVALLRKQSHDRQAERDNLPGLKRRGDFWMELVENGDWYLRGNEQNRVNANGRWIDVLK